MEDNTSHFCRLEDDLPLCQVDDVAKIGFVKYDAVSGPSCDRCRDILNLRIGFSHAQVLAPNPRTVCQLSMPDLRDLGKGRRFLVSSDRQDRTNPVWVNDELPKCYTCQVIMAVYWDG